MSENYVAQGPCFAVLPTVHGCHYAFQKFPFFVSSCITQFSRLILHFGKQFHVIFFSFPIMLHVHSIVFSPLIWLFYKQQECKSSRVAIFCAHILENNFMWFFFISNHATRPFHRFFLIWLFYKQYECKSSQVAIFYVHILENNFM